MADLDELTYEVTRILLKAGWRDPNDAQHTEIKKALPELALKLKPLLAEKAPPRPTLDERIALQAMLLFDVVIEKMEFDNGCCFHPSGTQRVEATMQLEDMIKAGYFQDDWNSLDGDVWKLMGDTDEAEQHFSREPKAYAKLNNILNDIFEGPVS